MLYILYIIYVIYNVQIFKYSKLFVKIKFYIEFIKIYVKNTELKKMNIVIMSNM